MSVVTCLGCGATDGTVTYVAEQRTLLCAGCAAGSGAAPSGPARNGRAPAKGDQGAASSVTPFTEIVARPIEWAWRHRVALSKLTALSGRPKIGKGLFYSDLIARVTRGKLEGDLDGPRSVILVTTEDEPGDTLKPRLMAAGADLTRVFMFQMGSPENPVPFRVPQDASELARRVDEHEAALVVIDPLVEFIDGRVDSHKSHDVRQALAAVRQIAQHHGCAIVVIFHLNKGSSRDPLVRQEGSAAFTQVVRGGLTLGHDPDDPDGEDGHRRVLAAHGSNLAPPVPSLVYRIETRIVDGDTGTPIETARMLPTGDESEARAGDLLGGAREAGEGMGIDDALEWLTDELADGDWHSSREVKAAAKAAEISEKTLRIARERLDVEYDRQGFPPRSSWRLPVRALPVHALGEGTEGHERTNGAVEPNMAGPRPVRALRDGEGTNGAQHRETLEDAVLDPDGAELLRASVDGEWLEDAVLDPDGTELLRASVDGEWLDEDGEGW